VVGVDYALAPEARYPVALNQVVGVVRWLRAHAGELGIDADRLALGGDSAGGSLSMGPALKLRDAGEGDAVKAILSIYGGFSPECSPASRQRYGTPDDMLTADEVDEFWANYVGHIGDRRDPYLVPVLAALQGLPPVFLLVRRAGRAEYADGRLPAGSRRRGQGEGLSGRAAQLHRSDGRVGARQPSHRRWRAMAAQHAGLMGFCDVKR
jgi:acetyl esterase/lipase